MPWRQAKVDFGGLPPAKEDSGEAEAELEVSSSLPPLLVPHSESGLVYRLSRPLMVLGGVARLRLVGRVQRQTVPSAPVPEPPPTPPPGRFAPPSPFVCTYPRCPRVCC